MLDHSERTKILELGGTVRSDIEHFQPDELVLLNFFDCMCALMILFLASTEFCRGATTSFTKASLFSSIFMK